MKQVDFCGRVLCVMEKHDNVSRRSFLSFVAAAPLLSALAGKKLAGKKHIPIGLELYSVRET